MTSRPCAYNAVQAAGDPAPASSRSECSRMIESFEKEQIENWVGDFCASDTMRDYSGAIVDYAPTILSHLLIAAREERGVELNEIEESDLRAALQGLARLNIPASAIPAVPPLCADFLAFLESEGRLSGGRALGAYVRAYGEQFKATATGKPRPIVNPGSKLGRNDPCPCGSGRKYKKCCMNE